MFAFPFGPRLKVLIPTHGAMEASPPRSSTSEPLSVTTRLYAEEPHSPPALPPQSRPKRSASHAHLATPLSVFKVFTGPHWLWEKSQLQLSLVVTFPLLTLAFSCLNFTLIIATSLGFPLDIISLTFPLFP